MTTNRDIKFRVWNPEDKKMFYLESIWNMPDPQYGDFELMQYTGLDDSNGIMIYEGDILQDTKVPEWKYQILWGKYEWRMALAGSMQVEMFRHRARQGTDYQYKVIGNIYENPDLLK